MGGGKTPAGKNRGWVGARCRSQAGRLVPDVHAHCRAVERCVRGCRRGDRRAWPCREPLHRLATSAACSELPPTTKTPYCNPPQRCNAATNAQVMAPPSSANISRDNISPALSAAISGGFGSVDEMLVGRRVCDASVGVGDRFGEYACSSTPSSPLNHHHTTTLRDHISTSPPVQWHRPFARAFPPGRKADVATVAASPGCRTATGGPTPPSPHTPMHSSPPTSHRNLCHPSHFRGCAWTLGPIMTRLHPHLHSTPSPASSCWLTATSAAAGPGCVRRATAGCGCWTQPTRTTHSWG